MANRDANVDAFLQWMRSKTDEDYKQMVYRVSLNRKEIAIECGFAKSVLLQNPDVRAALKTLEDDLRKRRVLPPEVTQAETDQSQPLMREPGRQKASLDAERLRRLEQDNAALLSEVQELKRQLEKFTNLQQALYMTGRVPR